MEKIIVCVVDKQALFRIGVRQALSSQCDFEIYDAVPGEDIICFIEACSPEVLLLDIDFPSLNGLEIARRIQVTSPATKIIMLTANPDDRQLFEIVKTGAVAYLEKDTGSLELINIIRKVAGGQYPLNESVISRPDLAARVLKRFQNMHGSLICGADAVVTSLTSRELQILNLIADGCSNKQIATILDRSEQTVKNHVSNILRKLNANDRAHAVVLAIRGGWIMAEALADTGIVTSRN